jgi:hypothetical protein
MKGKGEEKRHKANVVSAYEDEESSGTIAENQTKTAG